MFRTTARTAALVLATLFANQTAAAQEALGDRLTIHGSLNAGYGKSDGLPVFGINQDGTSNYRAVALQFGYKLGDTNRINLPSPYKTFDQKLGDDVAIGATFHMFAQLAFTSEGHKAEGYQFDVPVPTVVLPTTSPFNAHGASTKQAYYGIASVAVSF